ncbi:MAG: hypothetical protein GXO78_03500 [Calditrichaeota bacterium]|nr:hypothetical protein [Calditrichota bacterium]
MSQLPFKLSILVFLITFLSGFYLKLSLLDNLIRSFVIYLIFSVLELVVLLIYNQTTYNFLKAQLKKNEEEAAPEQVPVQSPSSTGENQ